jgi:hypothetical protein
VVVLAKPTSDASMMRLRAPINKLGAFRAGAKLEQRKQQLAAARRVEQQQQQQQQQAVAAAGGHSSS